MFCVVDPILTPEMANFMARYNKPPGKDVIGLDGATQRDVIDPIQGALFKVMSNHKVCPALLILCMTPDPEMANLITR